MNRRGAAAALLVLAGTSAGFAAPATAVPVGAPHITAPHVAAPTGECKLEAGGDTKDFWPQQRLNFTRAWSVTKGKGVTVGVVDSGLNTVQPQLRAADVAAGVNVIGGAYRRDDTRDCYGHGTAVTSLIVGQQSASNDFVGIAPEARIVPVKQTDTMQEGDSGSDGLARGIVAAIDRGATVLNVSIAVISPTPSLEAAVAYARKKDVVLVAAAGNDGEQQVLRPAYPAAYAPAYDNVIAVSATNASDAVARFSDSGDYVSVAAPGDGVPVLGPINGFVGVKGTSFAAPYVAGTAALVRAAHRDLTAAQVRARIEATADPPPADVPSRTFGYGIVNPFFAVTSPIDDRPGALPSRAARPLPAAPVPVAADRTLQHVALGVSFALLGLSVVAVAGTLVLRRRAADAARTGVATSSAAGGDPGDRDLIRR